MNENEQISGGTKRIYFKNNYTQLMFLKINGMSITVDDGAWIDVYGDEVNVQISGDFDFKNDLNELISTASSLKEKLAARAGKWAINLVDNYSVKAQCTYRLSNITDGETVSVELDEIELGSQFFSSMGIIVLFPSVKRNGGTELVYAAALNSEQTIKKYLMLNFDHYLLFGLVFSFLFYPIRKIYFRHLCKDKSLTKSIKNIDKFKARSEKRANRKGHPILIAILVLALLAAALHLCMGGENTPYDTLRILL